MKHVCIYGVLLLAIGSARAQQTLVVCVATGQRVMSSSLTSTPVNIRHGGAAETVGDIMIECTGGTPRGAGVEIPTVNVTITLTAPLSGRTYTVDNREVLDAVLLLDDPQPAVQHLCAAVACPAVGNGTGRYYGPGTSGTPGNNKNVYLGVRYSDNDDQRTVRFTAIPLDGRSDGSRKMLIKNLRISTMGKAVPTIVQANIEIQYIAIQNPPVSAPLSNKTVDVGRVQPAYTVSVIEQKLNQCSSVNIDETALFAQTRLRIAEGFLSSWRRRNAALSADGSSYPQPIAQNLPVPDISTESGFYAPALHPQIGLATAGLQFGLTLSSIPAGVNVFVPVEIPLYTRSSRSGYMRLRPAILGVDRGGELQVPVFFFPTASILNAAAPAASRVSVVAGQAILIYEVFNSNPSELEQAEIPIAFSYATPPGPGQIRYQLTPGPVQPVHEPAAGSVVPRFIDLDPNPHPLVTFLANSPCTSLTLAPAALVFTASNGLPPPPRQAITFAGASAGPSNLIYSVQTSTLSGGNWLTAALPSRNAEGNVLSVGADPFGLPPGEYRGYVELNVADANPAQQFVPVKLAIVNSVPFQVPPTASFVFDPRTNPQPYSLTLPVRNSLGPPNSTYRVSTRIFSPIGGPNWLGAVAENNGAIPGTVRVTVSPQGLLPGSYFGVVDYVLNLNSADAKSNGAKLTACPVSTFIRADILGSNLGDLLFRPPPLFDVLAGTIRGDQPIRASVYRLDETLSTGYLVSAKTTLALTDPAWLKANPTIGDRTPSIVRIETNGTELIPCPYPYYGAVTVQAEGSLASTGVTVQYTPKEIVETTFSNFAELAHFADGNGWSTLVTLINPTKQTAAYQLAFFGDDGKEVATTFKAPPSDYLIPAHGSITLETTGVRTEKTIGPVVGWVQIRSSVPLDGLAVFSRTEGTGVEREASVRLSSGRNLPQVFPFDNTGDNTNANAFTTSVAFVNPLVNPLVNAVVNPGVIPNEPPANARITLFFRDEAGKPFPPPPADMRVILLPPGGHKSFELDRGEYFPWKGRRGIIYVSSSNDSVLALGLRFRENGVYTSFAPFPFTGSAATPQPAKVLAPLNFGGQWLTTLHFANTGSGPATFNLEFLDNAGKPLPVPPGINCRNPCTQALELGAGLNLVTASQAAGSQAAESVEGWIRLTVMTGAVDANVIVRERLANQADREYSVRLTDPTSTGFLVPFDNRDGYSTEIAMVNPDDDKAAALTIRLLDSTGKVIVESAAPEMLAPRERRTFKVSALLGGLDLATGLAEVTAVGGNRLAGNALRRAPSNGPYTSLPLIPLVP